MSSTKQQALRGIAISSGVAQGTAYVLTCTRDAVAPRREVTALEVSGELGRFEAALSQAEKEPRWSLS